MKIDATFEGVQALRDFADAMPYAMGQIADETERLRERFRGLETELGMRGEIFGDIINMCIIAVNDASESISDLPAGLRSTADQLEEHLNKMIDLYGTSTTGESGAPRRGGKIKDTKTVIHR